MVSKKPDLFQRQQRAEHSEHISIPRIEIKIPDRAGNQTHGSEMEYRNSIKLYLI